MLFCRKVYNNIQLLQEGLLNPNLTSNSNEISSLLKIHVNISLSLNKPIFIHTSLAWQGTVGGGHVWLFFSFLSFFETSHVWLFSRRNFPVKQSYRNEIHDGRGAWIYSPQPSKQTTKFPQVHIVCFIHNNANGRPTYKYRTRGNPPCFHRIPARKKTQR